MMPNVVYKKRHVASVDFETVATVLRASAYEQSMRNDFESTRAWKKIKETHPELTFIEQTLSYIDPRNGRIVSISNLLRRPFFKAKDVGTERFTRVQNPVNFLLNKKSLLDQRTSAEKIQKYVDDINAALVERERVWGTKHREFCDASDKICGAYDAGEYFIILSNDPIDILMKSTGQYWENKSCERVGGQYDKGIFSDIKWCNIVAFLYTKKLQKPVSRIMVRTCETIDGEVSFGIEPFAYSKNGRSETLDDFIRNIKEIISSHGFEMEYVSCVTLYRYDGYSDNEGAGHTTIHYSQVEIDVDIHEILNNSETMLESTCPFCRTIIEWEIEWSSGRGVKENIIRSAFIGLKKRVVEGYYAIGIRVDTIDDRFFSITGGGLPERCPICDATRIYGNLSTERKRPGFPELTSILKKPKTGFGGLKKLEKKIVATFNEELQAAIVYIVERERYANLVKYIKANHLEREITLHFINALEEDEKKSIDAMKRGSFCNVRRSPIKIIERFDGGAFQSDHDDDDEYIITIKEEDIDVDDLAKRFVEKMRLTTYRTAELLKKAPVKPDTSKYKKLERFARR